MSYFLSIPIINAKEIEMLSNLYDRQSVFINRVIMSLSYMSGSVYEELLLHPNKITENIMTFCQS